MKKIGFISLTNYIIAAAIAFFIYPIIINSQGHEALGIYTLFTTLMAYALLANLGIPTSITINLIKSKSEAIRIPKKLIFAYLISIFLAVIIINVVYFSFGSKLNIEYSIFNIFLISFVAVLKVSVEYVESLMRSNLNVLPTTYGGLYLQVSNFIFLYYISIVGIDALILFKYYSFNISLLIVLYTMYLRKNNINIIFEREHLPLNFFQNSAYYFVGGLSSLLIFQLPIPASTFLYGLKVAGILTVYLKIIDLARGISSQLISPYLPFLAKLHKERNFKLILKRHRQIQLSIIILFIIFLIGPHSYLHRKFNDIFKLDENMILFNSTIVLASMIFSESITSIFLAAINKYKKSIILNFIQSLINLILIYAIYKLMLGYEFIILSLIFSLLCTNFIYNNFILESELVHAEGNRLLEPKA